MTALTDPFADDPRNGTDITFLQALDEVDDHDEGPSLPVILFSTVSGISCGVIALYVGFSMLALSIELTAAMATLGLLCGMGVSGAIVSAVTGARHAATNMLFSCGAIVFVLLFMSVCMVFGAISATLLISR